MIHELYPLQALYMPSTNNTKRENRVKNMEGSRDGKVTLDITNGICFCDLECFGEQLKGKVKIQAYLEKNVFRKCAFRIDQSKIQASFICFSEFFEEDFSWKHVFRELCKVFNQLYILSVEIPRNIAGAAKFKWVEKLENKLFLTCYHKLRLFFKK